MLAPQIRSCSSNISGWNEKNVSNNQDPNLYPIAKLRVLQKFDGFLCSLAITWQWHKASLGHKDTSHPRPSSVTSLFGTAPVSRKIDTNSFWRRINYIYNFVIMLSEVRCSMVFRGPSKMRDCLCWCSLVSFHLLMRAEVSTLRNQTWQHRSPATTIDGTSSEMYHLPWICHKHGTNFSDLPTSINTSFWSWLLPPSLQQMRPVLAQTQPHLWTIIRWRLEENERSNYQCKYGGKDHEFKNHPFTTLILLPQDSEALNVTGGLFKDNCSNMVILLYTKSCQPSDLLQSHNLTERFPGLLGWWPSSAFRKAMGGSLWQREALNMRSL